MVAARNLRWRISKLLIVGYAWTAARCVSAIPQFRALGVLNGDTSALILEVNGAKSAADNTDVQELYLEQQLNHFPEQNDQSKTTFRQRYFYSDRYAGPISRTNAPMLSFLCVGGEGPSLGKSVLVDSVHCSGDMLELARRLHEVRSYDSTRTFSWYRHAHDSHRTPITANLSILS